MINNPNPLLSDAENKVWCPVRDEYYQKQSLQNLLNLMGTLWAIGKNRGFFGNLFKNGKTGILGFKKRVDKIINATNASEICKYFDEAAIFLGSWKNFKRSSLLKEGEIFFNKLGQQYTEWELLMETLLAIQKEKQITQPAAKQLEGKVKHWLGDRRLEYICKMLKMEDLEVGFDVNADIYEILNSVDRKTRLEIWNEQCKWLRETLKKVGSNALNKLKGKSSEEEYSSLS